MSHLRYFISLILLTLLYHISAQLGLFISVAYGDVTPLWIPSGIALAVIWMSGWRWLPMILIGELIAAYSLDQSTLSGLWGGCVQCIEVFVALKLIRWLNIGDSLATLRDTFLFFTLVVLLAPALSAGLGSVNLYLQQEIPETEFLSSWLTWWLGDSLGLAVVAPLLKFWWRHKLPMKVIIEKWFLVTLITVGVLFTIFQFFPERGWLFFFLLIPYVVFSSLLLGRQGASLSLWVLTCLVLGEGFLHIADDFTVAIKMAFIGSCSITGFIVAAVLHEQQATQKLLSSEKQKAQTTLYTISDGVITTDLEGKVLFLNPKAEEITGWKQQKAISESVLTVCPLFETKNGDKTLHPVEMFLANKGATPGQYCYQFPNSEGEIRHIDSRIEPWYLNNTMQGTVIVLRDVTLDKQLQRKLEYQAYHDETTGLKNRRALNGEIKQLLDGPFPDGTALLYLDLDQFKLINDTCGHEVGDKVLIEIASLILSIVKPFGFVARVSGDEFAIIIRGETKKQSEDITESIRSAILEYRFQLRGMSFSLGASIGMTFITGNERSAADVLSRADVACHQAKEDGRNRIRTFHTTDKGMQKYHSEMEWISQLKTALEDNLFVLYQQGIFEIHATDQPPKIREVLIRLRQGNEIIGPGAFLPIAERYGFMTTIDLWVVKTTFEHIAQNRDEEILYNVNISGQSLNDHSFFESITQLQREYQIPPYSICFEVTENVALIDLDRTSDTMRELINLGFQFALDDFGSGFANHAYLERLPVQYVKLDGQFVRNINEDEASLIIVESLAKISRIKKIKCVAEWIETKEVLTTLKSLEVDFVQGYLFQKPEILK